MYVERVHKVEMSIEELIELLNIVSEAQKSDKEEIEVMRDGIIFDIRLKSPEPIEDEVELESPKFKIISE